MDTLFFTTITVAFVLLVHNGTEPLFIAASPMGFFRSLFFIEIGNFHKIWGWNIWVALRDGLGIVASRQTMWLVRTGTTGFTIVGLLKFFRLRNIRDVCIAGSVSMLVYLVTSDWTTYAYFSFLVPMMGLATLSFDKP